MSSATYEPVASTEVTEETSSLPPTRFRRYRVLAVVLLSIVLLASFYKLGNWDAPSGAPVASRPPTTPSQSDNKTEQVVMPHGKYSVG